MIQLREATFSDYTSIAALHARNWQQNYRGILTDAYLDNEAESERLEVWRDRLSSPDQKQVTTVAMQNNELVGFCCLILDEDAIFGSLIDNLHVTASLQKSGIGKMMIRDAAQKVCRMASNNKLYLWVFEANKNARAAYEKLAAQNVETVLHDCPDGSIAAACRYVWHDAATLLL